jgi:hypothetical protein
MTALVFEQRLGELPTCIGAVPKQHVEAIPSELKSYYRADSRLEMTEARPRRRERMTRSGTHVEFKLGYCSPAAAMPTSGRRQIHGSKLA